MSEDRTISDHPSTSGLQIALHPLALLTVSDYITRHIVRELQGPIIGALLGAQNGREISIEEAHEVNVHVSDDKEEVTVDKAFFENKLRLYKETHPTHDLVGWFSISLSQDITPSPMHVSIHKQLIGYNDTLTMLLLNPLPAASVGGKLPIAIYEHIFETDEADPNALHLRFASLKYVVETGEAEMIAMDGIAQGAGNASEREPRQTTSKVKAIDGSSEDKGMDAQTADMIASLQAKKNAIAMMNGRIKLLLSYLQDPPTPVNHQILREIKSLTPSRLPLLRPVDGEAYQQEKVAEEADVNLVVLLGAMTKSIEQVRNVGKKFAGIEAVTRVGMKKGFTEEAGDPFSSVLSGRRRGMERGFHGFL